MTGKRIIFYILTAFIAGTILLIYIQHNSAKNINLLIKGNEKLTGEYQVRSQLKELETDIILIENNVKSIVSTNDPLHIKELETEVVKVDDDLKQLLKISDDDSTVKQIGELTSLVRIKLHFNKEVLDSLHIKGKSSAEKLMGTLRGKRITDSILRISQKIKNTRQNFLKDITASLDNGGKKAQQFSNILIALVLICSAGLFWYIINAIRKQISLIKQLNISEKKAREAALIKEKFMANMSHEIRTPMNAILGFTNLLQRKNLDSESKEYVQTIEKSGGILLTIINDVLDLAKIEAGMMRIESAVFSIRGLVHSIEIMFTAKAGEKQLQLSAVVDEDVPDTLDGDAIRLTQILVNLIGNALKFTGRGSIAIKITNEGMADNMIKTGITVSDTGIGIEKDKLETIYERFQQAEDAVTRKYGGTGLGLSIVNELVLLQNGNIKVESEFGKGTSFRVMIPYKIANEQISNQVSAENDEDVEPNFKDVCILVVEDNEINQSLIKHLFKSWQLQFELANNGREAINKLQLIKYDLILMDIQMPEMDGYTATQAIREELKLSTPIIAMTAHALAGEREKCLSYGMDEYISKPIREHQLYKLITQFTHIKTQGVLHKKQISVVDAAHYKYIHMQYMKDVSNGNKEYEKTVTEQFIETIPEDLLALEKAWQHNDLNVLKQLAHNMKTTVSVMGLNEILQPYLDNLEDENMNEQAFKENFIPLKSICNASLDEAKHFYATL